MGNPNESRGEIAGRFDFKAVEWLIPKRKMEKLADRMHNLWQMIRISTTVVENRMKYLSKLKTKLAYNPQIPL